MDRLYAPNVVSTTLSIFVYFILVLYINFNNLEIPTIQNNSIPIVAHHQIE